MKPIEILNALRQLTNVMEEEKKYLEISRKPKFSPEVAIAIVRNRKELEKELDSIIEVEERNKKIAEKRGIPIEELEEQKELMQTDIEIDICYIADGDLKVCKDLSSLDFYALSFMTKYEQN